MRTALVGARGFVGGNLKAQFQFTELYDSSNSKTMTGQAYDLVVFAAARAEKWKANKDPEADRRHIEELKSLIRGVDAKEFILISTIDVYPVARDVNEDSRAGRESAPYGAHRFELETLVRERFPRHLVVRLPGLFGAGLKKNVIFDFLNQNRVAEIDSRGSFQFYNLAHLWADLEKARSNGLCLLNMSVEPVTVAEISEVAFGKPFTNHKANPPATYDFKSKHDRTWGGRDGYLYPKTQVLNEMKKFVGDAAKLAKQRVVLQDPSA